MFVLRILFNGYQWRHSKYLIKEVFTTYMVAIEILTTTTRTQLIGKNVGLRSRVSRGGRGGIF